MDQQLILKYWLHTEVFDFYELRHKKTGKYYVGSQYGKNSNPNNLWKTYFTSSKYVKESIILDGIDSFEIIDIIIRNDARSYERRFLKKIYYFLGKEKFLNCFLNRNIAPGIILTKDIISRANEKKKSAIQFPQKNY